MGAKRGIVVRVRVTLRKVSASKLGAPGNVAWSVNASGRIVGYIYRGKAVSS